MRPIKMFGLAAVTAVAVIALVGATSASAADTQLCKSHTALTCSSAATDVLMMNKGNGVLLNSLANITCSGIHVAATPLFLANPQSIHIWSLNFAGCRTKDLANNCQVNVIETPLANLNKTGLDTGTITGENGEFLVECYDVDIFGTDIHCVYDLTGVTFAVGAQHLTADDTPVSEVGSDFLCPNNPTLDGLLTTSIFGNRYVLA